MKRQNILVIIALLAAGAYLVSLQFPKNERIAWGRRQQKNNVELELKIEELNDLLQAIIQANLARHKVEQEHPQPGLTQKLQEVTAQKEALGQELIQAKASLELVRPMKQKENTADKNRIENLTKQLKEKEDIQAALSEQLDEEKANRQTASRNLKSISEELRLAKNTKSALERAISENEKEKDELQTTNTSLKFEIKKSEKELTSLKNTLGQLSKEKQALAKELDEAKAAGLKTEQSRKEKEQLRAELELLNKAYTDLRNEYLAAQEVLKQNEIESGRRADRILVLQEKLAKAEVQLADTQLKYTDMEKESTLGREQNVAAQLEREDLKNQLQQAKLRLNELENQASQILKLLKSAGDARVTLPVVSVVEPPKEESKRIEVELYPITAAGEGKENTPDKTPAETITQETVK
jgi:chromosome segregation ATPase